MEVLFLGSFGVNVLVCDDDLCFVRDKIKEIFVYKVVYKVLGC